MTPDEANAQSEPATGPSSSVAPRSGGRGRYSRGRRRPRRSTNRPRPPVEAPVEKNERNEPVAAAEPYEPLTPPFQPAKVASIQAALEKVTAIIGDLRDALNDMELVLEYLEDAERQQAADEREIVHLQQRLNMIHRRGERGERPPPARSGNRPAEETAEADD